MMKQISAGGGVLFRKGSNEPEVLLIYRRGVWDLPKGKKEAGESLRECAVREVSEEVGSALPHIHAELFETYHEYTEGGQDIAKQTKWFAMTIPDERKELTPETEEGIEQLKWVPLTKAKSMVEFPNLLKVLQKFEEWYYLG